MISVDTAVQRILKHTSILGQHDICLDDSVGRILARDILASLDLPSFDKAVMDGYALRATDVKKIPARLTLLGLTRAGGPLFKKKVGSGQCVKIMTGAVLPSGADTVVKVEDTTMAKDGRVVVNVSLKKGAHIYRQGSDLRRGQKVLSRGKQLSLSDIAFLAAVGQKRVCVVDSPVVSVVSTGEEIINPGDRIKKGQVYNSNGPQLTALLKTDGIVPGYSGLARDHEADLGRKVRRGLQGDVLLISGGVSMGDYDLVPEVLKKFGVEEVFHKVRVKPGKPLFFGRVKKTLVFGLPGNPVSAFCAYHLFVRPALLKMKGFKECRPQFDQGVCVKEYKNNTSRRHFVPVTFSRRKKDVRLTPVSAHGSADVVALSRADGFMVVPEGMCAVKAGAKVFFMTWKKEEGRR